MKETISAYDHQPQTHQPGGAGAVIVLLVLGGLASLVLLGGFGAFTYYRNVQQVRVVQEQMVLEEERLAAEFRARAQQRELEYQAVSEPETMIVENSRRHQTASGVQRAVVHGRNSLVIDYDGQGGLSIDGAPASLEDIGNRLDQARRAGEAVEEVVIQAEQASTMSGLVELLDLVKDRSVPRILMMSPSAAP